MGDGLHINSEVKGLSINGLKKEEGSKKVILFLEKKKKAKAKKQIKLRDWLFSRQRYWGEPFPVYKKGNGEYEAIPDNELPVLLPKTADYEPTSEGEAPLARVKDFVKYKDKGERETDTMPGSAASSWYFLRYTDPKNDKEAFSFEAQKYWMPVDLYIGGKEHSVGHLLYSRFWQKFLFDEGLVSHEEPFLKLAHQGLVLGEDGFKMSKSRKNDVSVDKLLKDYGADCSRLYICFLGPFDKDKPWSYKGIEGIKRFLGKFYRFVEESKKSKQDVPKDITKLLHQTIKKVGEDIESLDFNTAISSMMILLNETLKKQIKDKDLAKTFTLLLQPFAPHIAEEAWERLGEKGFACEIKWPEYEESLAKKDLVEIGVQVNGKKRASIKVSLEEKEEEALKKALDIQAVKGQVGDKPLKKVIYKPGRILNLIV